MKHYNTLLLFVFLMLISTFITAQTKVKCTNCKNGIATWSETISCTNCKSWEASYRNIKGCDVCKNNKVISIRKQGKCLVCKGTSWYVSYSSIPSTPTKEQQILKKIKDLNLSHRKHIGYFRLNFDYSNLDVAEYRMKYDKSYDNLWYLLGAIMNKYISYSDYKEKAYALLDYYELMYTISWKSDGWPNPLLYYPSSDEVKLIKSELDKINSNPNYEPKFFGMDVDATELIYSF